MEFRMNALYTHLINCVDFLLLLLVLVITIIDLTERRGT